MRIRNHKTKIESRQHENKSETKNKIEMEAKEAKNDVCLNTVRVSENGKSKG